MINGVSPDNDFAFAEPAVTKAGWVGVEVRLVLTRRHIEFVDHTDATAVDCVD